MPDSGLTVVITIKDIYDAVKGLEGKVSQLIAAQNMGKETVDDHETRIRNLESHNTRDHDLRISNLERFRWQIPSLAALLGIGSLIIGIVALFKS